MFTGPDQVFRGVFHAGRKHFWREHVRIDEQYFHAIPRLTGQAEKELCFGVGAPVRRRLR
ncbi:hypothetical protein GCM10029964_029270 [Kibdelosporangium lantanae]